jgi:Reverse transcriptase (RNA-dependent DNA polymerase)
MVPYEKRRKLDDKAVKVKFVGYDECSKGYRFVDERLKVVVSREVRFLESKSVLSVDRRCDQQQLEFDVFIEQPKFLEFDLLDDFDDHREEEDGGSSGSENEDSNVEEENYRSDASDDKESDVEEEPEEMYSEALSEVEAESVPEKRTFPGRTLPVPVVQLQLPEADPLVTSAGKEEMRRSARVNFGKPPSKLGDVVKKAVCGDLIEPKTYKQAVSSPQAKEWLQAMEEELQSIRDNRTWELTDLPANRKPVGSKWVFKLKLNEHGVVARYKARLVAQGFSQKYGVDYDQVFAPVARHTTMRLLLSVAGAKKMAVRQYDVKTAFLNGALTEEIYMKQPVGFASGDKVYRLRKSLYGLKQAARVWNQLLDETLKRNGFKASQNDKCLYIYKRGVTVCYFFVHVDDVLVASNDEEELTRIMKAVGASFELKDMGAVKSFLGIEVQRDADGHFLISQSKYIEEIAESAGLSKAKGSKYPMDVGYYKLEGTALPSNEEYRKLIGMLLYLTTNTRPDIAASVSILSSRVSKPRDVDISEAKRVIRYVKGTKDLKLRLSSNDRKENIYAVSDASWAEDRMDRKSSSGYYYSVNGGAVSWCSRKQNSVAQSSTESEYIALSEKCKEISWLRRVAEDLDVPVPTSVTIYTDSQSCMSSINNQKFSNRTKHIDTRCHAIKDLVLCGAIVLTYRQTDVNVADMMTKPLGPTKIAALRRMASLEEGRDRVKSCDNVFH